MSDAKRFVRRNRVDERNATAIAVVAGVVAVFSGAEPTGSTVIDWLLIVASVGAVVWASASAPWWAPAGAGGVAAVIAFQPVLALIGALAFVGGLVIGVQRRDHAEFRALVSAVALNVLIRSQLDDPFGATAIVGAAVGIGLFVVAVRRRPSAVRRRAWIATGTAAVVALVAVAAAGLSALSVRNELSQGNRQARLAVDLLNEGDYEQAAVRFADSSRAFSSVDRSLGGPLARLAALVPGVAQNVTAGADLAATARDATAEVAVALDRVDANSLRVVDSAIDLDAVRAVEQPLLDVQASLTELRTVVGDVRSPWLVGRFQTELDELDAEFADKQPQLDNAIEAVRLAPQLLGGDVARRYMVMFTSPVEARGVAGFMGNYAIVELDNGRVEVTEFGRRSELEDAVRARGDARCDGCPPEMMARYGSAGLDVGDGSFGDRGWSAITMPAHFPYVGEAAQIMYPQSGGQPIDGVVSMDPYVVQALMGYTGPIELTEIGRTVKPKDAAQFLLEDQYLVLADGTNAERIEAIDTLGQQVIDALLTAALPVPSKLAGDVGPLVEERRLLVWTDDPTEQALLERIGLLGALPVQGDDGGFSVMVSNQGRSKVDAFLDRTVDTEIVVADDGTRTLVADVTLTNDAPADGLPRYVIGNSFGFPNGSSYLWVNFFGPDGTPTVTRNGTPIDIGDPEPEAGWWASPFDELIGPGETVTYRVEYSLDPAVDGVDAPTRWDQPLARRDK